MPRYERIDAMLRCERNELVPVQRAKEQFANAALASVIKAMAPHFGAYALYNVDDLDIPAFLRDRR